MEILCADSVTKTGDCVGLAYEEKCYISKIEDVAMTDQAV